MPAKTLDEYLKQAQTIVNTTAKQQATKPKYRITGFYKETEFQETPIGKIPKEWSITKLRNIVKINESKVNMANLEGEVARIPMELVPDDGIYAKYVLMPINEIKSYVTAKAGDILLAKITPSFENGKQGIVPDDVPHGIALVTTEVYPITPINIERLFLLYILKWRRYRKLLEWKMTGTTGRRRVPKNALENLLIPLPPLEEQWGVAEVLSALDRAIEATERLIERLERLKRGLIQELLTRGIGHREYKQTLIGKIPKEWNVSKLEYLASAIYYGVTAKAVEHDTGLRMLRTTDIKDYKVDWDSLPYCEITSKVNDIKKYLLRKGDLIVARAGTVGVSVLVDSDFDDVVFGSYLIKVRPKENLVYPKFLHYYFQSMQYWKHISKAQGSTLKNINLGILKSLLVPIPPLEEQKHIVAILSTIDKWIELEKRRRGKFERLKRGLMELLLTGRVRVRVKRINEAEDSSGSGGVVGR